MGRTKGHIEGGTRVQLEMPPKGMERLLRIKARSEATSYTAVVCRTLKICDSLMEELDKGAVFIIKRPDGTMHEQLWIFE